MAVVFKLTGNTLSLKQWEQIVEAFAAKVDFELWEDPELDEGDGETVVQIVGEGSVRGVVFFLRDDEVEMLLSDLASRRDWRSAFRILRAAVRWGGGTVEADNGESYDATTLSPINSERGAVEDFVAAVRRLRSDFEPPRGTSLKLLAMGSYSVPLRMEHLPPCSPEGVPALEAQLSEYVSRYGLAYRPTFVHSLKRGGSLTTWAAIPTILPRVDVLAVNLDLREQISANAETAHVPFDKILSILGDRAEYLGNDTWFLPGLEEGRDENLVERLRADNVDLDEYDPNAIDLDDLDGLELDLEIIDDEEEDVISAEDIVSVELEPFDNSAMFEETGSVGREIELDAEQLESYVITVMREFLAGKEPLESREALTEQGVDPDLAAQIVALVGLAANTFLNESGGMNEVLEQFAAFDVPEAMSLGIVQAMAKAFEQLD